MGLQFFLVFDQLVSGLVNNQVDGFIPGTALFFGMDLVVDKARNQLVKNKEKLQSHRVEA